MKKIKKFGWFTTLAIALTAATILSSCMKKPETKVDYGPEVAAANIADALEETQQVSVYKIKKGEFAYVDTTQKIDVEGLEESVLQNGYTVIDRRQDDNYIYLDIVVEENRKVDGVFKSNRRQDTARINRQASSQSMISTALKSLWVSPQSEPARTTDLAAQANFWSLKNPVTFDSIRAFEDSTPLKITYHNLKKTTTTYDIPLAVRNRSNCGGLLDCQLPLRATMVSFDRVVWNQSDRGTRSMIQIIGSPDAPFFAYPLVSCVQSWIDVQIEGQTRVVVLRECSTVKDFTFGTE